MIPGCLREDVHHKASKKSVNIIVTKACSLRVDCGDKELSENSERSIFTPEYIHLEG